MTPFNIAALLRHTVNIPNVDLTGCDGLLWKEGDEIYWLDANSRDVYTLREGALGMFITSFPEHLTLCIMNDETGKPVRISPLAN